MLLHQIPVVLNHMTLQGIDCDSSLMIENKCDSSWKHKEGLLLLEVCY